MTARLLRASQEPPHTRGECIDGPRPCPWFSCRHHLAAEASTCSLDVADEGPHTFEEIGAILGLTRERIRQIEVQALGKMSRGIAVLEQAAPTAKPHAHFQNAHISRVAPASSTHVRDTGSRTSMPAPTAPVEANQEPGAPPPAPPDRELRTSELLRELAAHPELAGLVRRIRRGVWRIRRQVDAE